MAAGTSKDVLVDGTLFKSDYHQDKSAYRVISRTPVEDSEPLELIHWVDRFEATQYRDGEWIKGHSIDSAAMAIGIAALQKRIPGELRKIRRGEKIQSELETLEGFASF